MVVLKDPEKPENYLVRRLAAIQGYEMVSTDEKDEPFILEKDECWVLADNEKVKPKVLVTLLFEILLMVCYILTCAALCHQILSVRSTVQA